MILPTPPGLAFRVLWVFRFGELGILEFADVLVGRVAVHRETSSQSTKPQAYISIRKNASREKFIAPSKTSGAIYRLVPT